LKIIVAIIQSALDRGSFITLPSLTIYLLIIKVTLIALPLLRP